MTKSKRPTDAAIVKAFQKYEEAMNVCMELVRAEESEIVKADRDHWLYRGHRVFREYAVAAQSRIDAKKEQQP